MAEKAAGVYAPELFGGSEGLSVFISHVIEQTLFDLCD